MWTRYISNGLKILNLKKKSHTNKETLHCKRQPVTISEWCVVEFYSNTKRKQDFHDGTVTVTHRSWK